MSKQALFSIIISALTTGYTAATISYDFDVSINRRKEEPEYYGYMPDGVWEHVLFVCMIVNGALLLIMRSLSTALLAMAGWGYVVAYYLLDQALYVTWKVVRNDFWHWPDLTGNIAVVESILNRPIIKFLVDFTGLIQFR
jgi:hypothetical protein